MLEKIFLLNSPEETEALGLLLGTQLRGGECIELSSDLGGGKTTFTRGLVRGLGSLDPVASPTFTIGKRYKSGDITCYHYDFYRLQDPGLVAEELSEAVEDTNAVIIVEWADSVANVLPQNRMIIQLDRVSDNSESRKCRIKYSENFMQMMENVAL